MEAISDTKLYTISETSRMLGISRFTIRRRIGDNTIKATKLEKWYITGLEIKRILDGG